MRRLILDWLQDIAAICVVGLFGAGAPYLFVLFSAIGRSWGAP